VSSSESPGYKFLNSAAFEAARRAVRYCIGSGSGSVWIGALMRNARRSQSANCAKSDGDPGAIRGRHSRKAESRPGRAPHPSAASAAICREVGGDPGAIRGRHSRKRLASFARPRTRIPSADEHAGACPPAPTRCSPIARSSPQLRRTIQGSEETVGWLRAAA
jgi:hypothetical protein